VHAVDYTLSAFVFRTLRNGAGQAGHTWQRNTYIIPSQDNISYTLVTHHMHHCLTRTICTTTPHAPCAPPPLTHHNIMHHCPSHTICTTAPHAPLPLTHHMHHCPSCTTAPHAPLPREGSVVFAKTTSKGTECTPQSNKVLDT
jgi:hypothetical protein